MRRLAACLGALLLLAVATSPYWLELPRPRGALEVATAVLVDASGAPPVAVDLPHSWPRRAGELDYQLNFELAAVPPEPLYLFIPMLAQRAVVSIGGHQLADTGNRARMIGVSSGVAALVVLPADRLVPGHNTVDIRLATVGLMPGYLSAAYVGTSGQLGPAYRLRIFLLEHLRLMVLAAQLLIIVAVLMACLYRPREPLFLWLLALLVTTMAGYAGLFVDLHPRVPTLMPYAFFTSLAGTGMLSIVALLINGTPPPRLLQAATVFVPAACMLLAASGLVPPFGLVLAVGAPLMILSLLATAAICIWGAWRKRVQEARLMLVPLLLLAIAAVHDGAVAARVLDGPVFLAMYYRPLLMVGIAVILMRRLGVSLRWLDEANANLARRLAEREQELERLHAEDRVEAAERARSEERQRLTADLHDGLSGHLASIVALAEREGVAAIERTAREALDDLRLVIHSLDIGDRELPVALGDFRDRLARQLKRLGIELEWSIARLPEISGVTPAHALNVLRIVQEAVTNAIRHGRAARIVIRGGPQAPAGACIVVENDGAPFASQPGGRGLENMRRRAAQLGGAIAIEAWEAGGARLTLSLPLELPQNG
ncbi:sensor histidine kinase [Ramlibacter sp.]|uniref:sensor histidine kinase n=1 Tax=Ramlibacter sp. TaxID=1917967 RepID=UPI002D480936|nr:ATP-binding protein [Ramlibacter sp.]HYD76489.1 ATP-binding protein [Ramlibacter sp.]